MAIRKRCNKRKCARRRALQFSNKRKGTPAAATAARLQRFKKGRERRRRGKRQSFLLPPCIFNPPFLNSFSLSPHHLTNSYKDEAEASASPLLDLRRAEGVGLLRARRARGDTSRRRRGRGRDVGGRRGRRGHGRGSSVVRREEGLRVAISTQCNGSRAGAGSRGNHARSRPTHSRSGTSAASSCTVENRRGRRGEGTGNCSERIAVAVKKAGRVTALQADEAGKRGVGDLCALVVEISQLPCELLIQLLEALLVAEKPAHTRRKGTEKEKRDEREEKEMKERHR